MAMDSYPVHLAPIQIEEELYKEPFQTWWSRVQHEFPNVPQNVAKQWIYRHWNHSPFGWIKSSDVSFTLIEINISFINRIFISFDLRDPDETRRHGDYLRDLGRGSRGWIYWLAAVMERRQTWPVPPIILNHNRTMQRLEDYPKGSFLIEGHQRLSIMRSLIADGLANESHVCWLMKDRSSPE